ncbi:tetratricopeptide repeat protein [Streptomyces sp. NPDC006368]|uniref:serine/threonine-protein kinase n=1 Tax=Streptomyces sp. NPDC006368 TaxID=3156760 RepID=UPI0033B66418
MGDTRLLQGRYRLHELIGRGGMGEVWRATDESLGRRVAVKCLKPLGPQRDEGFTRVLRERFRREARVAAALQHRGVTVVHDFGEWDGLLYLVMELLDGRNLSQVLEDHTPRPLPVHDVVDIAAQVAEALAHTHRQGIVHRDLKPANIMRLTDGTVKICDFGIARLGGDIGFTSRLTGTGIAMGTPHYMSPEQISGNQVDHRSDLYSLGCVLYEIATGVPPFDLDDAWAILIGHRDTPPEPPRRHRPELPVFFERLVLDLLAKTPGDRPPDAADLCRRITGARAVTVPVPSRETPTVPTPNASLAPNPSSAPHDASGVSYEVCGAYAPAPRLPSWARGMTTGPKAVGVGTLRSTPPDPAAGLSGEWTTAARAGARPAPPSGAGRSRRTERPTPPPGLLADLADLAGRHDAGLGLAGLGRWEEAYAVHRAVAAERERLLGPDHPDTLAATRETAYALGRLGRHVEAHRVYAGVLTARERTVGADHPDTLRCRHDLALNLGRQGRFEESYRMAADVAGARALLLGPEHPDTLATRHEVAYALGMLGRWDEALEIHRDVAAARAHALGPHHPDTLAARYEVGIGLGRLGRTHEALELYRDLVDARTRAHGPDDPETLRARHGLGVSLGRLARWDEALAEAREVCAIRERVLGPDHPDTLVSCREVAVALGWLGRWSEALAGYRRVAAARERVLGSGHPDALAGRNDEAHCLERLGRHAEAVGLYRRVAVLKQRGGR